jgi:DNA-binding response OmpR family regulator
MYEFEEIYKYSKNLSVLYVEDDLNLLKETCEIFNDYFKRVDIATNGKDGLDKYLAYYKKSIKYYDIVITDINRPNMNGIELAKEIYKFNKQQPIIIISAHDEKEYLLELINLGIEQFLVKPLELDKILSIFYSTSKAIYNNTKSCDMVHLASDISWNKNTLQLLYKEREIKLSKKETLLISILLNNGNKISTINELFYALWDNNIENASLESLKSILSRFRRKVPSIKIENIYGLGYRLSNW